MSHDPAVEAAQRAWADRFTSPDSDKGIEAWGFEKDVRTNGPAVSMTLAARAALVPIRELHKPVLRYRTGLMEDGFYTSCDHCDGDWPCDTARLIYTSEELTND